MVCLLYQDIFRESWCASNSLRTSRRVPDCSHPAAVRRRTIPTALKTATPMMAAAAIGRRSGSCPWSRIGMITLSVIQPITRAEAMMAPANIAAPKTAIEKATGCILTNRQINRLPSRTTVQGVITLSDMTEPQFTTSSLV